MLEVPWTSASAAVRLERSAIILWRLNWFRS